ncbi:rhomboid family intramembrane serine protease [Sphingomonas tagetis]|uniref:rhomboid family intramembrane serine protease n=1 Tax=Sphingomonas tagetis TaxID=2949092 RepID=UPI0020B6B5F0|nr:rhomboid family intramembrane serine protease [Sphingomonas tagetis]
MANSEGDLVIRSRHGLLRDAIPIYSLPQLIPNLAAVGVVLWLSDWRWPVHPILLMLVMLGWVFQFSSRPSVMAVSYGQAKWLEALLEAQGFYCKSDTDGHWSLIGAKWWRRFPHQCIKFDTTDHVTVVAPRDAMEALRASIELIEEHGELVFSSENQPFSFEPPGPEVALPWQAQVPGAVLGASCVLAFIWSLFADHVATRAEWGLSAAALSQGRFETVFLHMFAHGGVMHLMMNMIALAAIGATLTSRLGVFPLNWLRLWLVFALSALAGAALFLALHPTGAVPMVGASGGLYGLIGLLIRLPADGEPLLAVWSRDIRRVAWDLVKQNAFLFALLALMSWSSGNTGGLAWEAHLGGFLFGMFLGPKFLPRASMPPAPNAPSGSKFAPAD